MDMHALRLFTLFALITCCAANFNCSAGWDTRFGNSCYKYLREVITWTQASLRCRENGGHLVVITNPEEQKYVHDYFYKHRIRRFWIDGKDEESENHWYWDWTGKGIQYSNWQPGQPDNGGQREHCLMMYSSGQWSDMSCNSRHLHAICEKEDLDVN